LFCIAGERQEHGLAGLSPHFMPTIDAVLYRGVQLKSIHIKVFFRNWPDPGLSLCCAFYFRSTLDCGRGYFNADGLLTADAVL